MKRKISTLFKGLCCSHCRADFDENSVVMMREEDAMIVFKLVCNECNKSFGVAFLGLSDFELKTDDENFDEELRLEVQEGASPITEDDVLDAHKFIKELDGNWHKHINAQN